MKRARKAVVGVVGLIIFVVVALSVSGCATTKSVEGLQEKVNAASEKADQALNAAEAANSFFYHSAK